MPVDPIPGLAVRVVRLWTASRKQHVVDLFAEEHVRCRKEGITGVISGPTSVADVYWVMHDSSDDVGVYWREELDATGEGIRDPLPSRLEILMDD